MTVVYRHAVNLTCNRPLPSDIRVAVDFSPVPLSQHGFKLPVELSTASVFRITTPASPLMSITVMALLDTGATITSLDINVARYLQLQPIGHSKNLTASGSQIMPNFVVDACFPGTKLLPFNDLRIGSCDLGFDPSSHNETNVHGIGLLIGRDIMSRWNIVWNGPSSTVIISD